MNFKTLPRFEQARAVHERLIITGAVSTCLNCKEFSADETLCTRYGIQPPAEIIVYGCPEWDDIPF